MSKLKIGVIGAGSIAGIHLPHLAALPDVELTALADVNPAGAGTAENFGFGRFVSDYRDILPLVDAVLICVPTFLHAAIATETLRAGKPTFCEKPLTRTLREADALAAAARESQTPCQVGFVRRFDAEWLAWGAAIADGAIGRPVAWNDIASFYGPEGAWFYDDELGGGPFLDACIHNYDFALKLFGPAQWAFCNGWTWRQNTTAIDTGTATIRFRSGDELMLKWSWVLPTGRTGARVFEVLGPRGALVWPADETQDNSQKKFLIQGQETREVEFPASALSDAFRDQMAEFIAVARGQQQPRAGIAQGRAALQLALAVLKSARVSERVNVEDIIL